jgi:hypothetical protein
MKMAIGTLFYLWPQREIQSCLKRIKNVKVIRLEFVELQK